VAQKGGGPSVKIVASSVTNFHSNPQGIRCASRAILLREGKEEKEEKEDKVR